MILDLLDIVKGGRFVVVAPHPNDEVLGAGGVLLDHPGQIDVFVVSDGGLGNFSMSSAQVPARRRAEFERSMELARPAGIH